MPLYEYQCEKCGDKFEVMQKFADERLTTHDKCGGHVQRLLSVPALQFKGSGFYINDYAKSGSGGASEGSAKKADTSEAKSSSNSESTGSSKPAASSTESKSSSSDSK